MKEKILNYFGADGFLHILCCIMLMNALSLFLPVWTAALAVAVIAFGKEQVWDKAMGKGSCDAKDFIADVIGILLGAV